MVWIKNLLAKLWDIVTWPYRKIRDEINYRRRLKKLREQDPFIYK